MSNNLLNVYLTNPNFLIEETSVGFFCPVYLNVPNRQTAYERQAALANEEDEKQEEIVIKGCASLDLLTQFSIF